MSSTPLNDIYERVNREIINKSLAHEEGELIYSQEILDYIGRNMSADDKKACLHLNKGKMVKLMSCPPPSIMKAKTDIAKMMEILRNIGAQHGGHFGEQGGQLSSTFFKNSTYLMD